MGEEELAALVNEDCDGFFARTLARKLENAARRLDREHARIERKPKGSVAGWRWDDADNDYKGDLTFAEALSCIRTAARWYAEVGNLGHRVHRYWT